MLMTRTRFAAAAVGATTLVLAAGPALAASTVNESLSNFKISGPSSAKAGSVTFKVSNKASIKHELIIVKTSKKASKLTIKNGRAVEYGNLGEVELAGGKSKSLKLNLKKGHYVLFCNVGNHYSAGMYKDFTVK